MILSNLIHSFQNVRRPCHGYIDWNGLLQFHSDSPFCLTTKLEGSVYLTTKAEWTTPHTETKNDCKLLGYIKQSASPCDKSCPNAIQLCNPTSRCQLWRLRNRQSKFNGNSDFVRSSCFCLIVARSTSTSSDCQSLRLEDIPAVAANLPSVM